jgi:hypothetical protein
MGFSFLLHHMLEEVTVGPHGFLGLAFVDEGNDEGLLACVPTKTKGSISVLVGEGCRLSIAALQILLFLS